MKVAIITDQHFGARNDSIQFHEYFSRYYKHVFFPFLEENGIDTIVELGDIFDRRKYVNFDTLSRCKDYWFDEIKNRGLKLHCVVGNHDIYFKNTNRINAPSLLLGEYEFEVYDEPTVVNLDGLNVLMMPWINSENYESAMKATESGECNVCMGHLELQGFEMYKGAVIDHGMPHKAFQKFDMVMSGHFHHKSSKDNIHYLGAPYEMTWSDYNDPRGFHVFDTDTLELEHIVNEHHVFHKVFYDDVTNDKDELLNTDFSFVKDCYIKVVVKQKNNPYVFDMFMDKINNCLPTHTQVVEDNLNLDIEDTSDIINEAEDTRTIIQKYISSLNLEDAQPVQNLFNDLYHEAISSE